MRIEKPVILFDGICNLCNGSVDFVLKHDRKKQFMFIPLQSEKAKCIIHHYKISNDTDSVILISMDRIYAESDAILEITGMLGYPWKLGKVATLMPRKLRNMIYRLIAKSRYRLFGKRDFCRTQIERNDEILCSKT